MRGNVKGRRRSQTERKRTESSRHGTVGGVLPPEAQEEAEEAGAGPLRWSALSFSIRG